MEEAEALKFIFGIALLIVLIIAISRLSKTSEPVKNLKHKSSSDEKIMESWVTSGFYNELLENVGRENYLSSLPKALYEELLEKYPYIKKDYVTYLKIPKIAGDDFPAVPFSKETLKIVDLNLIPDHLKIFLSNRIDSDKILALNSRERKDFFESTLFINKQDKIDSVENLNIPQFEVGNIKIKESDSDEWSSLSDYEKKQKEIKKNELTKSIISKLKSLELSSKAGKKLIELATSKDTASDVLEILLSLEKKEIEDCLESLIDVLEVSPDQNVADFIRFHKK